MPTHRGPSPRGWGSSLLLVAAFALFSPLSLLAVNAPRDAPVWKFLLVALLSFAVAAGATLGAAHWLGRRRATGIICALLFVFFAWSALLELGQRLSVGVGFVAAVLALLVWAAWRFGEYRAFQISAAAIGIGLLAVPVPALIAWYASEPVDIVVASEVPSPVPGETPDIYFVVLDGYGRGDVLEEIYDFSNESFVTELERRGFQIPEWSRANYSSTASSVSSTLAMEYLVAPGTTPDYRFVQGLHDVIGGANPVVQTLKSYGYHYAHIEGGWDGARCGPDVDTCYRASFLDEAMWTVVGRTPIAPVAESWLGHAFALNGLRSLEDLAEEATVERPGARFVFGHVLLPHPPLTVDASCEVRSEPEPGGPAVGARSLIGTPELERRRSAYVEQVECVNQGILRFLDELDEDAVVFITGDHGPDSYGQMKLAPDEWTDDDIRERLAVMSAYRLPEGCRTNLPADLDLINGMRILYGCAVQEPLPVEPVSSYVFPLADGPPNPTTEIDVAILGG